MIKRISISAYMHQAYNKLEWEQSIIINYLEFDE